MRFLPMLFSHDYVCAEHNVVLYARRFLEGYDCCEWQSVVLENGGGFMHPGEGSWRFVREENHGLLNVSAEAAGIIITGLVLNHRSWFHDRHDQPELCEHYCQRFRQLADYGSTHPKYDAIYQALN